MKDKILKLRAGGKTYNQIVELLGCAKSTVSYYCGNDQREKSRVRQRKNRATEYGIIKKKIQTFVSIRIREFKVDRKTGLTKSCFNYKTAFKQLYNNPVCYLTGRKINFENAKEFELDHIITVSKGGKNTLKNMGLTCRDGNQAKSDMNLDVFIQLCKEVCEHNGYEVVQK